MDKSGDAAHHGSQEKGEGKGRSRMDETSGYAGSGKSSSQREGSVHRQIRKIQNPVCDVYAQGHDGVHQAFFKDT